MSKVRSLAALRKEAEEAVTTAYDEVVSELKDTVKRSLLGFLGLSFRWDECKVLNDSPLLPVLTLRSQELAVKLMEQPLVLTAKDEKMLLRAAREAYFDQLYRECVRLAQEEANANAEAACRRVLKDILPEAEADDS